MKKGVKKSKSKNVNIKYEYKNFFDKTKFHAIILDKNGEHLTTIDINRDKDTFNYGENKFLFLSEHTSYFKINKFWSKNKYFVYHIDNPHPINLTSPTIPSLNTKVINQLMETKVIRDLNNVSNKLSALLTPKNIIIGIIALTVFYLISTGQLQTMLKLT